MRKWTALLLLPLLAGCIPSIRPSIESLDQLEEGEVVVVGRVSLSPPMKRKEQKLATKGIVIGDGFERLLKAVLIINGDYPFTKDHESTNADLEGAYEAAWDKLFFIPYASGETNYIQQVSYTIGYEMYQTGMTNHGPMYGASHEKAYMPCNCKLDLRKGDRVVYIGTIQYFRDEFNAFKGVRVVDEMEAALPVIKKRFGGVKVRKALVSYSAPR